MYLMEQTFWKIGGVVKEILFDNLAPVAARPRTLRSEGELAEERRFLQLLPERSLELARVERQRVSKDCFISVDGVHYSVPWEYVGKVIEVRMTETEIQLFTLRGSFIASHRRLPAFLKNKYGYVVRKEHYVGLSGTEEAFENLEKLQAMGFGPFYVERRELSEYQEVVE